jgi:hypothetical protein
MGFTCEHLTYLVWMRYAGTGDETERVASHHRSCGTQFDTRIVKIPVHMEGGKPVGELACHEQVG